MTRSEWWYETDTFMPDCVRITACRLCDSPDLGLIVSFTPTPPGDAYLKEPKPQTCYPLDLMVCRSCGAVQLADTVDPKLIYSDYTYTTSISKGLDDHFARYADDVVARVRPRMNPLVIDIGSNDGTLLRHFINEGCSVLGIDPAERIAHDATENGVPTQCAFFTNAVATILRSDYVVGDIITANNVIANVADLHDFIEGVKTLLAPDGTFVFETGYWPAIYKNNLVDTIEHEHIHYFAVIPLVHCFQRHGLQLVHVEEQPTKGGSLRGFVKHLPAAVEDSVPRLMLEKEAFIVDPSWPKLCAWEGDKPDHERWVGYGAAVGSTLLLHQTGLGRVLSELWDDNTSRHGLYSPGFHLPVVPPNSSHADRIVILAWRYAEMIMAAHPEHKGKWIIPLPELRFA